MNTLSTNIRVRLRELGMTQKTLAEKAGISQVMVHKLLTGKTTETSKLLAIAKALECDPVWLQTGKEGTFKVNEWKSPDEVNDDYIPIKHYPDIQFSAGNGTLCDASSDTDRVLFFKSSTLAKAGVDKECAICVTVYGNSMEPVILDGSTVGIDCSNTKLIDGKIYAITHGDELYIKKLYRLPNGGMRIYSFNEQEYPVREYTAKEITEERIEIKGRVFWYSSLL